MYSQEHTVVIVQYMKMFAEISSERRKMCAKLYGFTSQKTLFFMVKTVGISNHKSVKKF